MPWRNFVQSNISIQIDIAAKRYGKTPSQLLGLVDHLGNPDKFYGLMLDIALSTKFSMEDDDRTDSIVWQINQYIASVGKALKMSYPSSTKKPPKPRIDRLRESIGSTVEIPTRVPTQSELFKKWNIKG